MRILRQHSSLAAVLALFAAGCGESTVTQVTGPTAAMRCQTALTGLPASFPPSGARLDAAVSTTRECPWTIESEASWVQVAPKSGQGEAPLSIVVSANPAAIQRSAALVVNGTRVTVAQDPAPCRFALQSSSSRVPSEGGRLQVAVDAVPGCVWRATSETPWVQVVTAEITGSGAAELVIAGNTGGERSGTVRVAGDVFLIQQAAAAAPSPGPAPPPGPTPPPGPAPPPAPDPAPAPPPVPPPAPAPLRMVMEPQTMPDGYVGESFLGLTVRALGGTGPYRFTGTNLLGWPSSLSYDVDPAAGTAYWRGPVTREGEFPVRMGVEDSRGARAELMLTFVFKPARPAPSSPLTIAMEPRSMPIGYVGEPFPGLTLRAQGGKGPYRFTGTNLLGWPSSLSYDVDAVAGTARWHGRVTREGEFPVRMVVEDSTGAQGELMLTFVFRPAR